MKTPMRICLVSAEVAPFAKTGGLADVAAAVSRHLGRSHDVRVIMPLYRRIREGGWPLEPHAGLRDVHVELGTRSFSVSVQTTPLPDSDVSVFLLDCPELFDGDSLYGGGDEYLRFALLSRASIHVCQWLQWAPDILHCNDWHTALIPLYLKAGYAWDRLFEGTKTLLTIHNIGYQGVFPADIVPAISLDDHRGMLYQEDLEQGRVNLLKTGLLYADALTTVSETYAQEIQTAELGMGLEDVLRARRDSLFGIVNGVDYGEWDPEDDPLIPYHFSRDDLEGKGLAKKALLQTFDLAPVGPDSDAPLVGMVSRLTAQKGFELLPDVLPVFLQREDLRFVVLGSGEDKYERYFQWLRDTFPTKVAFYRGYSEELAHEIEAAADLFLMPSLYEPCGLNQMYSLRYGTVPLVRRTGGLADTVRRFDPRTGEGTGFSFNEFTSEALLQELRFAFDVYRNKVLWRRLVQNGMAQDFSWEKQGRHYVELYEKLLGR